MKVNSFSDYIKEDITYSELGLPEPTYEKYVIDRLVNIFMDENGISEKSFKQIDELYKTVKTLLNDDDKETINDFEKNNLRVNYCAEVLYDKYKNNI